MDRRDFLKRASLVTAGAAVSLTGAGVASGAGELAAPAIASGIKDVRIAVAWPVSAEGPFSSARRLARRIETATGGRYRFHLVSGSKSAIAAIASGDADAYHACEHDNAVLSRAFTYFAGLPGYNGLRASALDAWMIAGGGQLLWDELAHGFGVKAVLAGHTGPSTGLWSRAPIVSADALAGTRIWSMGLGADVVRSLGAEAITAAPADVAIGLAEGRIDAAEAGGAVTSLSFGMLELARNNLGVSLNRAGTALSLGFSRPLWDAMSSSDQAIISSIASAELHASIAEEKASRNLTLTPLRQSRLGSPPRDIANAISRISDAVVAHLAATDAETQRINASYVAFRRALGLKRVALTA